jgi:hypothetical protein
MGADDGVEHQMSSLAPHLSSNQAGRQTVQVALHGCYGRRDLLFEAQALVAFKPVRDVSTQTRDHDLHQTAWTRANISACVVAGTGRT